MNRLTALFERNNRSGRKALSFFLTAGFPSIDSTLPILFALEESGADLVELGIPFSDPIADGPTIQQSSDVAIHNGVTIDLIFGLVEQARSRSSIPIVLMGYANPIYAYGLTKFLDTCARKGVDGVIIPDIPLEEGEEFRKSAAERNIAAVQLATPTSDPDRIRRIDDASTGFLYCVSVTGVTGGRSNLRERAGEYIQSLRGSVRKNPVLVGFGIATPDDARFMGSVADGIIIGSALLDTISRSSPDGRIAAVRTFAQSMRSALDSALSHSP